MRTRAYYTLAASLPRLPDLERAERLPITPYRLEQRLRMLDEADAGQLARARALAGWRRPRPLEETDAEVAGQFRRAFEAPMNPALREFIEFRMTQLTLQAALRRRHAGADPPSAGQTWGAGPWVRRIEANWSDPDFKMAIHCPWIAEVRRRLEAGDAVGVERALMQAAWRKLGQLAERRPFAFEAVFAFVFKWDILQAWLTHDATAAQERFRQFIQEVTDDNPN